MKGGDTVSENLDLNTATEQELTGIYGIRKEYAKKIVDYRNQHGPFKSWEDVRWVPVMSFNMLDTLKRHGCTVRGKAD